MKGKDRNAPCWCGSGEKFKKCHYNRDTQLKDNPWDALDANKRAFSMKKCFARNSGLGDCKGAIVKAHTVSRGPNLSKIAKDGHVLHYAANIPDMRRNGGKLSVERIGIRDASAFYGFCSKHDRELFSCIENEPFVSRPDQCLALAYRTMSRELYGKDAGAHLRETLRGADKGSHPFNQLILQTMLEALNTGNEAARRELKATHDTLSTAMAYKNPDAISSLVFEFEEPLPFMFSGAWSPFTDLYGNKLQHGLSDNLLEQVLVSSFVAENRSTICITWRKSDGAPGGIIAGQIKALPTSQQATACIQLTLKHVENVFFNPEWFQALSIEEREQFDKLAADGLDFMGSVPSVTVQLDMNFHLPETFKSFYV